MFKKRDQHSGSAEIVSFNRDALDLNLEQDFDLEMLESRLELVAMFICGTFGCANFGKCSSFGCGSFSVGQ